MNKHLNKVVHGDSLTLLPELPNDCIDLIVTSPPYFNVREEWKFDHVKSYLGFLKLIFTECMRVLKPSRMCCVNISVSIIPRESRSTQSYRIPIPFYFVPLMEDIGFEFLEDIIWVKPEGSVFNRNGGFYVHRKPVAYKPNVVTEYIFVFKKKADFLIDKVLKNDSLVMGDYERTNVWAMNPENRSEHPVPFPKELPLKCIQYYSYEGDVVLDPFCGSGTTLVVAKEKDRNFIGFDHVAAYVDMANKRLPSTFNDLIER